MESVLLLVLIVAAFSGFARLHKRLDGLTKQLNTLECGLNQIRVLMQRAAPKPLFPLAGAATPAPTAPPDTAPEATQDAAPSPEAPASEEPPVAPPAVTPPIEEPPPPEIPQAPPLPQAARVAPPSFAPKKVEIRPSAVPARPVRSFDLEMLLGTRVLARVGMLMVIVASAYFLRYAYDQQWIGPKGRILIGALIGLAALAGGEYFRRQRADVLFQTLTGGAIGIFYVCVYFAFHIYQVAGAGLSFGCASVITLFALTLAVLHNSMPIAILGQIGGFLSPILLSTGGNHPYALFCYVTALNLTAFGAAFFRCWRSLDLLSFVGTIILYQGWYAQYHDAAQMLPALLFTTLFYVMFLTIPSVYGLLRRSDEGYQGLTLIAANAMHSLLSYHEVLYADHRQALGFTVLAQALIMYLLFRVWRERVGADSNTVQTLLVLCLALVTLVIPILLSLYAVPIAWATEAVVLNWMANRYGRLSVRIGGSVALVLAVFGLLNQLPFHTEPFVPVFNPVFASWLWVALAAGAVSWFLNRWKTVMPEGSRVPPDVYQVWTCCVFVLAYALAYGLFTAETCTYWQLLPGPFAELHMIDSLLAVWTAVLLVTGTYLFKRMRLAWLPHLIWIVLPPAGAFLISLDRMFRYTDAWLFLNPPFLTHLFLVVTLWILAGLARRAAAQLDPFTSVSAVFTLTRKEAYSLATTTETVAHGLLALLLAVEFMCWGRRSDLVSYRMALSMISAAWAMQAFFLIWHGLWSKQRPRRVAGLVLFGFALVKILLYDTLALERVYRIVAWGASGLLLVAAAIFYQRYLSVFKTEPKPASDASEETKTEDP